MESLTEKAFRYMSKGRNCSQTIMQFSLDLREIEQPFAIDCMAGLGGGMQVQRCCGTLSGGVCVLSSYFPRDQRSKVYKDLVKQLVAWFEQEFGGTECKDLVVYENAQIMQKCPGMVAATFEKCVELLVEAGVDPHA